MSLTQTTAAPQFEAFCDALNKTGYDRFMYLSIYVDSDDQELRQRYQEKVEKHNRKIIDDPIYADAGFDLMSPDAVDVESSYDYAPHKLDFKVQCSAGMQYVGKYMRDNLQIVNYTTGYYMFPRSSLSKTILRLANSTGIIDAGYRGHIMGMFDILPHRTTLRPIEQYDRVVQICAPSLVPIFVNLVSSPEHLGPNTSRNTGGFGSTGH
jgi:hypothetical protein